MKKTLLTIGIAAVTAFSVSACGSDDEAADEPDAAAEQGGAEEAPEPDLEGIPDVVADVNGEEISKDEFVTMYEAQFQQLAMQAQMSGEELDQNQLKTDTAEGMVDSELLLQEADHRGFDVSDDEIDSTLADLAEQNGLGSPDEFIAAMGEQGLDEEELMDQLETQVKVEELINDEAGDVSPTDEELQQLYDEAKEQQEAMGAEGEGSEMPPFDEVKPQLEEQAESQAQSETAQELVDGLRENAEITINL